MAHVEGLEHDEALKWLREHRLLDGGGLARDAGDAVQRTRRGRGLEPEGQGCSATGPTQKIALRAAQGMFSLIGFDADGWTDPKEQSYDSAA